jgi:hypothetical protein
VSFVKFVLVSFSLPGQILDIVLKGMHMHVPGTDIARTVLQGDAILHSE